MLKKSVYDKLTSEAVTLDEWRAILERAKTQAEEGDDKARRFLASLLLNKKDPAADADSVWKQLITQARADQDADDGN